MTISIFAEDAGTTREETDIPFKRFYQGGFLTVSSLADQLGEYGDVQLHILSERFGLVRGGENVNKCRPQDQAASEDEGEVLSTVLERVADSDVVVILLSSSRFDSLIVSNWEQIVDRAKPDSVWCLGAARSSLDAIDFDPLQQKNCEIVTYERVGVARISNEVREKLLEQVEQQQSE
ncbi:hypothetical protein HISP_17235 [Haloarcula hispanica N601]|uniref:Uncharacterized protein n=2 Tax=Haloarcula hispanica TaxID=51589 RepID=V5TS32_HALHI|nr:hypothetical protein [Haloarcula hispanica]AEM59073.1 conserved hypothetical protein [Haloarcula hispanica ATCC 33960]AHB67767.1 hypothetical protein HISP_17235 [Haloarcula hispanica N601]